LLKVAANISTLFRELALLERFQAASAAGFDGVEMQVPYTESPGALARAAEAAEMPVVLINAPVTGEYPAGLAGRPEMSGVFRSQLAQIREYAEALKVRFVHVLAGRINSISTTSREWVSIPPRNSSRCCRWYGMCNLPMRPAGMSPERAD
jgi:hydroxypyruvate isomerase